MSKLNREAVVRYVEQHIDDFHSKRLKRLQQLRLNEILKRKNPYLFRVKNILTAERLVQAILEAYLSSQEETIFGDFLEGLAIYINHIVFGGRKSAAQGIDLEFERDSIKYLVAIKSGPNWGNSRQIAKMKDDFRMAKKILRTSNSRMHIIAVNGCCYGREKVVDKGEYLKLCGQRFWEFISDDENLYTEIIEPLGHEARKRNDLFQEALAKILNQFTFEFSKEFCPNGLIDWQKLVQFSSSAN